jgi:uncharacterized membrane protein
VDKETATIALVLVTILGVFAAIYPILPSNQESFSELGILGPTQKISGYPQNVTVGQPILLYAYLGNHEGTVQYYQLLVKLGNESTVITNSTYARAPVIETYYRVLDNNQNTTFPMGFSVDHQGINQRLIFELWSFNSTLSTFDYTGLWNQIWMNVTAR